MRNNYYSAHTLPACGDNRTTAKFSARCLIRKYDEKLQFLDFFTGIFISKLLVALLRIRKTASSAPAEKSSMKNELNFQLLF